MAFGATIVTMQQAGDRLMTARRPLPARFAGQVLLLTPLKMPVSAAASSVGRSVAARAWRAPSPNAALMWVLGIVNRWVFLKGLPVLRRVPVVRDLPFVHGYFWIRRVDFPETDRSNLSRAVNRETVAFIGPNHPEFGTDWLIDQEVSSFVAPQMASWADRGIVNAAPRFWGMNNLIANDGGDAARDYSIGWAIEGEGVLLHPEGTVRWTNDQVHPLFPGIAQMAMRAAERTAKPVYIAPLVWKYRYTGDVSRRIRREIGLIEKGLKLPRLDRLRIPLRFEALQKNILAMRMRQFGYVETDASTDFFARQSAFQAFLLDTLEEEHGTDSVDKRLSRIMRTIRGQRSALANDTSPEADEKRATLARRIATAEEARRLGEFTREVYGTAMLTQEQLFESLKRTRDRLLRHGWKNTIANMLPRPFGPRVVHIGVPEPIRVVPVARADAAAYETALIELTQALMQDKLDEINRRIAPAVAPFSVPNPFVR
ncbi:MAG: hypothetical protein JWM95_2000 [Gemmatimonadetes bacterium]|nr:hypothetical protein [Gemmatimonadota bacterium]